MSVCLSHRQWITYANIIPRLLIVYVSPTQLVIDGIWETRLIQHVKKILAYQILVGAQSTACFATCAIKSPPSCQNGLKLEMFWGHIVDRSTQENNQLLQKVPNENDRHAHDMCNFYSITLASCWVFSQFVSSHLRKKNVRYKAPPLVMKLEDWSVSHVGWLLVHNYLRQSMELSFRTLNGCKVETHSRSVRFVSLFSIHRLLFLQPHPLTCPLLSFFTGIEWVLFSEVTCKMCLSPCHC
jgi:hypothetical protein